MKTNKIVPTKGHPILVGKDLELELVDYTSVCTRNFSMTIDDVRELGYNIALANNLIDENEMKKVSRHWYYGFMNRRKQ